MMRAIDSRNFVLRAAWNDQSKIPRAGFPYDLPAVRQIDPLAFRAPVAFFVGENGSGKSTILEALAILAGCNPEGGSQNFHFSTANAHQDLHKSLRLVRGVKRPKTTYFLRAESYFNLASNIDSLDAPPGGPPIIGGYGGRSLHQQSHGESFMALLMNRFGPSGLYFLDEPEAALSPTRQLAMLRRVHQLCAEKSQFIIATHSPILIAYPHAEIYLFDKSGCRLVDYTKTEHYAVTRDFLNNPEERIRALLKD